MPADIMEQIGKADALPSLPTVAVEVLRLTRSEDSETDELAAVIEQDPALTANILKVVNSPLYGVKAAVTSLSHAMNLLGRRSVRVLALSFSLTQGLSSCEEGDFDYESFWRRSLTMAVASRLMAKDCAATVTEEAFIVGLLANIGMIACHHVKPTLYRRFIKAAADQNRDIGDLEQDIFGATHSAISEKLLEDWGLPKMLSGAVGAHLGEGIEKLKEPAQQLAKITHASNQIADLFCETVSVARIQQIKQTVCEDTGIPKEGIESLLETLDNYVKDMASILSLRIGETINFSKIQLNATQALAKLSIQSEVERAANEKRADDAEMEAARLLKDKKAIIEVASTDSLTKLANRAAFDTHLAGELDRAQAAGQPIGLIMLDVDHFKLFNDTHGHQAGDEVLRKVGATLIGVAKKAGFAARYGGEEFAIIVPNKPLNIVHALADLIRRHIEKSPVEYGGSLLQVTASLGIASIDAWREKIAPDEFISRADKCLYDAKSAGRNRVVAAAA